MKGKGIMYLISNRKTRLQGFRFAVNGFRPLAF